MSNGKNPWQQLPPKPRGSGSRFLIWLLLLAAGAGLWKLSEAFPGALSSDMEKASLVQTIGVLGLVMAGVVFSRAIPMRELVRNIAMWAGIAAVLAVGFAYRSEFSDLTARLKAEFISGEPLVTSEKELVLARNADGHFYAFGEANGTRIRFLVDTGASDTVLSPGDAVRAGIDVNGLKFTRSYGTANGLGLGASYRLALFSVGPIEFEDMPVSINQADMRTSLLGMSFLNRLASYEVRGDRLFLRRR